MSAKDVIAFGSARAYKLAEEDENAARMYPLNPSDGPAPYYLPGQCPIDTIEDVARGLAEGVIQFDYHNYVIRIGQWEWVLDSNLQSDMELWRSSRLYAKDFGDQCLLIVHWNDGMLEYRRA